MKGVRVLCLLSFNIDLPFASHISMINTVLRIDGEYQMTLSEQVAPFYFCIDINDYTGISAASYEDFLASIKKVSTKSLYFHSDRGDFTRWALYILKDKTLAREMTKLKNRRLRGQALRNSLYLIVSNRYKRLISKNR